MGKVLTAICHDGLSIPQLPASEERRSHLRITVQEIEAQEPKSRGVDIQPRGSLPFPKRKRGRSWSTTEYSGWSMESSSLAILVTPQTDSVAPVSTTTLKGFREVVALSLVKAHDIHFLHRRLVQVLIQVQVHEVIIVPVIVSSGVLHLALFGLPFLVFPLPLFPNPPFEGEPAGLPPLAENRSGHCRQPW